MVCLDDGPTFVTNINNADRSWEANKDDIPYLFTRRDDAEYVSIGIMFNCNINTYVVSSKGCELSSHPYRYSMGKFSWQADN